MHGFAVLGAAGKNERILVAEKYAWKHGARMKGDPQAVGERIEKIRREHRGDLKPVHVVNDARSKSSPIHPLLDWNDRRAAESWRLEQASKIIGSIEIRFESGGLEHRARAYVSLPDGPGRRYHDIRTAMSRRELRSMMLQQALDEATVWRDRYQKLQELSEVFAAIGKAEKRVKRKQEKPH